MAWAASAAISLTSSIDNSAACIASAWSNIGMGSGAGPSSSIHVLRALTPTPAGSGWVVFQQAGQSHSLASL